MDQYSKIADQIIKAQESILGPIAREQAKRVSGLKVEATTVEIQGDEKIVLENLIKQYEAFFGRASVEVCKDAVKSLTNSLSKDQLPSLLQ